VIELRDGSRTSDPRLDRLVELDHRSRKFRAVSLVPAGAAPVTKQWDLRWLLDQGQEGACTNFGLAHNRLGSPKPKKLGSTCAKVEDLAFRYYNRSKQLDQWSGEDYSGTSLLAACKAWREAKLLGEYRWCFGIDDLILTLGHVGPVVLATDWLDSMFDPGPDGHVDTSGNVAGGHAYNAVGVILHPERSTWRTTGVRGEPLIIGPNSWGPRRSPHEPQQVPREQAWGRNGWWAMSASQVEKLLKGVESKGEACIPLDRPA
jgi:hypothetical protein